MSDFDVLMLNPLPPLVVDQLAARTRLHRLWEAKDREAEFARIAPRIRGIASGGGHARVDAALMGKLPALEIVACFGVGYDQVDAAWAGEHGIIVTHTPDVLNEEVADTTFGLLLNAVRQLPQAERYLRAGKRWIYLYRSKGWRPRRWEDVPRQPKTKSRSYKANGPKWR